MHAADRPSMELRHLIGLIPFPPARGPLLALLDRIEDIERRLSALERTPRS